MTTPQRPECFEFALDFLGDPEAEQLRTYIEQLEALSQPQPPAGEVGELVDEPTDDELRDIWETGHLPTAEELANDDGENDLEFLFTSAYYRWLDENPEAMAEHEAKCLRAVFNAGARWGRPAAQPIPVSERLPEAGDCDAEGRCWAWDVCSDSWVLHPAKVVGSVSLKSRVTHWLPAHALPLPSGEGEG